MVGNAEVILGLVQLGLQAVHTGDGQHELGGVRPHLPWEERERGKGRERRYQAKKLVYRYTIFDVLGILLCTLI